MQLKNLCKVQRTVEQAHVAELSDLFLQQMLYLLALLPTVLTVLLTTKCLTAKIWRRLTGSLSLIFKISRACIGFSSYLKQSWTLFSFETSCRDRGGSWGENLLNLADRIRAKGVLATAKRLRRKKVINAFFFQSVRRCIATSCDF